MNRWKHSDMLLDYYSTSLIGCVFVDSSPYNRSQAIIFLHRELGASFPLQIHLSDVVLEQGSLSSLLLLKV